MHLVDPGVEPYKPKKGQANVLMAVGLQVRILLNSATRTLNVLFSRETVKLRPAPNSRFTIRNVVSSQQLFAPIPSVRGHSTRRGNPPQKPRSLTLVPTRRRIPSQLLRKVWQSSRRSASRSSSSIPLVGTSKNQSFSRRWSKSERRSTQI